MKVFQFHYIKMNMQKLRKFLKVYMVKKHQFL